MKHFLGRHWWASFLRYFILGLLALLVLFPILYTIANSFMGPEEIQKYYGALNDVSGEFVTKGDANAKEDMEPVSYENFLGKVTLSVPMLGGILAAVVTVPGKIAAGSMILLALVLHVIAGKLKGSSKEQ